jgi:hypothetical protein
MEDWSLETCSPRGVALLMQNGGSFGEALSEQRPVPPILVSNDI